MFGAVAIDVDHIPLYVWGGPIATGGGRPVAHSLATVVALLAVAVVAPRIRTAMAGLAAGVHFHLVRDIATGPGIPLWWPLGPDSVLLPYRMYLCALIALSAVAVVRQVRSGTPAGRRFERPVLREDRR
jgi:inner membrane protein